MRWTTRPIPDSRVIKRFAFLPIEIGSEVRWLEWVKINQVRNKNRGLRGTRFWENKSFFTEPHLIRQK